MAQGPTTISTVTVATAGVAVKISSTPIFCSTVIIEADTLNTGNIYWGGSSVSSTNGNTLVKTQNVSISYDQIYGSNGKLDLSKIYLDADTSGNKVRVTYWLWDGF